MKNIINQITEYLIFLLLGMLLAFTVNNKKPEDVNNDGKVDSQDLLIVKRYLINKECDK